MKKKVQWFWTWVIGSIIFRLILIYFPKNLNLSSRPEVATPLTSIRRCKLSLSHHAQLILYFLNSSMLFPQVQFPFFVVAEGYWLKQSSMSPYAGLSLHFVWFNHLIKLLCIFIITIVTIYLYSKKFLAVCVIRIDVPWLSFVIDTSWPAHCDKVRAVDSICFCFVAYFKRSKVSNDLCHYQHHKIVKWYQNQSWIPYPMILIVKTKVRFPILQYYLII